MGLDPLLRAAAAGADPVRVALPFGTPCWLVTGHAQVRRVLSGAEFDRTTIDIAEIPRTTEESMLVPGTLSCLSGADHQRQRKLLMPHLQAGPVRALHGRIEEIAQGLITDIVAADGPVDLVAEYCNPLAMRVFCEMFGVPFEDCDQLAEWTTQLLSYEAGSRIRQRAGVATARYLYERVERGEYAEGSLLATLVAACGRDEVSFGDMLSLAVSVVLAGFETTSHVLAKFLYRLLTDERLANDLARDGVAMDRAVEELLRVTNFAGGEMLPYRAAVDVVFGSVTIRAGEYVVPAIGSANMDPAAFPEPDRIDIDRSRNPHLSFGFGTHFCAGAPLARAELAIGLAVFLRSPLRDYTISADGLAWETESILWPIRALVAAPRAGSVVR
ncbi:cytochrome P450 [Nocardia sp. NPDC050710]|uniref:cytochrome P450 n=1 Tax=Nocardia sp. NPDC050710 TaxID=3157220 RepID=UPI0033C0D86D